MKMLHHIALTVNYRDEIDDFYKEVLQMDVRYSFTIDKDLSISIFGIERETDVFYMQGNNTAFELFVSPEKEKPAYSHVCLAYSCSEKIFEKAEKAGYKTFIKKRSGHDTYFIWDKSGNMFEIKEIEDEKRE
ncbi:MAG: VOC family protein [Prolixibacteraceae bacterium]|nr:VOC family protein [Prolixibacteraceae bacterium]